ncbi:MarR family winged helix-turn-helix transcriptional regulator [Actinacidiphila bryophytorum]|uniref:MarR family transcriptional regulator n=1 Tax=Actinacidiphila bryophytorum TaxID=1436133 RepID=A0A9W4H6R4_9ACTN|nr:MarR family transcriptional regulator [Actinacidiphila bryophytorum]MBM9436832.1 MarR family transcriptional regulator [Actinacidiphila bryophytorum]MBN6542325.1 MarR family transcriptional regulator [Actinacidiphila bryophytorum]CAG7654493.1 MarR family transcriptional regulator [Actinacidiphila bryophytorum]
MPAPDFATHRDTHDAAQTANGIVELLDVMWESARETANPAPASASQLRLMYVVDRFAGIRMHALCKQLATTPPSVSRMCDRLQALGFLERLPCADSGREVALQLTSAGQSHLQRIREQRENMLHQAINAMPEGDRRALAKGLAGLHLQLTHDTDAPAEPPGSPQVAQERTAETIPVTADVSIVHRPGESA